MRSKILILVTTFFAITALGFAPLVVVHHAPQGRAFCGLTVALSVSVSSGGLVVEAAGANGDRCNWVGMDVSLEMRDAVTGLWESVISHSGIDKLYTSGSIPTDGYERFRAEATAFDEPDHHKICQRCSPAADHEATTFLAENL